jgi:hypothetical protein
MLCRREDKPMRMIYTMRWSGDICHASFIEINRSNETFEGGISQKVFNEVEVAKYIKRLLTTILNDT